jgi:TRAP-type C4-dicarboxylate transport system permease large subunit
VVIGGILAGIFTPTEGSCIAVVYSLGLSFIYRSIKVKQLPGMLLDATRTTAVVMFLIGVSSIMGFVLSIAEIPAEVSNAMFSISDNPVILLLLIAVVLLIFTPIFLPIVTSFGIIMVFTLCIGVITPPVGPVLFIGAKVAGVRIEDVFRRLLPFFGALVVILLMVIFTPSLSLWLPTQLGLITP